MKITLGCLVILALVFFAGPANAKTYSQPPEPINLTDFANETCAAMQATLANLDRLTNLAPQDILKIAAAHRIYVKNCVVQVRPVGLVYPKYYILSLIYAPPGCTGCSGDGKVEYEGDSSTGTKISTEKSFKNALEASVGYDGDFGVVSYSAGVNGGFSLTKTDSFSVTSSKENNFNISNSSAHDGVDHDLDVFFLLMNPAVMLSSKGVSSGPLTTMWSMGHKGKSSKIAQIAVSVLKECSHGKTFSSSSAFSKLAPSDCQTILNLDPFVNGSTLIDPNRFVPTTYEPSYSPSPSCLTLTYTMKNDFDTANSHAVEKEYTLGYSLGAGYGGADLKFSQDFTWTSTSTLENTTSGNQSASFTLPCPSSDYAGDPYVEVYWDTLYGTFMFMPRLESEGLVVYQGHVANAAGKLVLAELSYAGKTYHTTTDRNGNYRFFGRENTPSRLLPATGQLSVRGVKQIVTLRRTPAQIRLP